MKLSKIIFEIEIEVTLLADLIGTANQRRIPAQLFIEQILSTQMLIEKHISPDDNKIIMDIYRTYLP